MFNNKLPTRFENQLNNKSIQENYMNAKKEIKEQFFSEDIHYNKKELEQFLQSVIDDLLKSLSI